jgi:hypothetical protein
VDDEVRAVFFEEGARLAGVAEVEVAGVEANRLRESAGDELGKDGRAEEAGGAGDEGGAWGGHAREGEGIQRGAVGFKRHERIVHLTSARL